MQAARNLGPASWHVLQRADITSIDEVRALGAVPAFVAVKRAGFAPSINLLWALHGVLAETDWKQVARDERTALPLQLDDYERGHIHDAICRPPQACRNFCHPRAVQAAGQARHHQLCGGLSRSGAV